MDTPDSSGELFTDNLGRIFFLVSYLQNRDRGDTFANNVAYRTPLCPLSLCIREGNTDAFKRALSERTKNPNPLQADLRGWTALHFAAIKDDHADCLKLLLSNKDTLGWNLDAETFKGETAFFLACAEGCLKNCKILLESQCDHEKRDWWGYTQIHIASIRGHANIVSQLIAHGLNPNCVDPSEGNTALHYASIAGNLEVVRVLMTSRQIKVNIGNGRGELPLHYACRNGSLEIVGIVLEADPSLVNWCNIDAHTPLLRAIQSGNVECVKYLLDRGADANHCANNQKTIFYHAADSGIKKILELVVQATSASRICERITLQMTHFLSATTPCWEGHHSLISSFIASSSPESLSLLLESGIPKGILEIPYVFHEYYRGFYMHSPIAYLFRRARLFHQKGTRDKFDKFLRLLLQHNITHLYEFRRMIELKAPHTLTIHYVHPFTYIFQGRWWPMLRDRYLNTLLENGITTDYSLQCDVHYDSRFVDFDANVLQRFYIPVEWAINVDDAESIELLLVNSAILEPSHLWNFLQYQHRRSVTIKSENPQNVVNYLIDLGVTVNDMSNLSLYPFGGTIKCPKLQQLCRQAIRKQLRDVTLQDNLKNFKQKINALPLPNSLKNYLNFK